MIEDKSFPVTRNLFTLLQNLRYAEEDRMLWIDAVCIEQSNAHERNHQVQQMRKVYASADRVIVWLGCETSDEGEIPDTNLVMIALDNFSRRIIAQRRPNTNLDTDMTTDSNTDSDSDSEIGLSKGLDNDSDSDLDMYLAPDVDSDVDNDLITEMDAQLDTDTDTDLDLDLDTYLDRDLDLIWEEVQGMMKRKYSNAWERQRNGMRYLLARPWFHRVWIIQEVANARRALVQSGTRSLDFRIFSLAPELFRITPTQHCKNVLDAMPALRRAASWMTQGRDLYSLRRKFRQAKSSLECDKVYALLGICSVDEGEQELSVDYERSIHQVINDTISHICFGSRTSLQYSLYTSMTSFLNDLESLDIKVLSLLMRSKSPDCLQEILRRRREHTRITQYMFQDAVNNKSHGQALVKSLLDSCRAQVKITEDILIIAARNESQGLGLVEDLLQHIDEDPVRLTQNLLLAGAHNRVCGSKIVKLLLVYFPEDQVTMTSELAYAAIMNELETEGIERELYQRRGLCLEVSEPTCLQAARGGSDFLRLMSFAEKYGQKINITDDILDAVARNSTMGSDTMEYILQRASTNYIEISERVLVSTVENLVCGKEIMRVFLRYRDQETEITENVVLAIVRIGEAGVDMMHVIRHYRESIRLTRKTGKHSTQQHPYEGGSDWSSVWSTRVSCPLLWWAIDYKESDLLQLLIEKGVSTSVDKLDYGTPLHFAVKVGYLPVIRQLVGKTAEMIRVIDYVTPLLLASKTGNPEIVQLLLHRGSDPDVQNRTGATALLLAAGEGHSSIVKVLLLGGAEIEKRDHLNLTPLMKASSRGRSATTGILLERGAQFDAMTHLGWTALHFAAEHGDTASIQLLLDNGADINAQTATLWTPLLLAILHCDEDVFHLLLERGAKNNNFRTDAYASLALLKQAVISKDMLQKAATWIPGLPDHCFEF